MEATGGLSLALQRRGASGFNQTGVTKLIKDLNSVNTYTGD